MKRFTWRDAVVLGVIIVIGLVNLPIPPAGDQALWITGAQKISQGEILYRDFWDLKQPGIYGFYLVAGTIFGFDEIGIHTFELIYMAIFSVVLMLALRGYYDNGSVASLVPLLTVGIYYGISHQWHITQVEGLVGFPLFLSLWFASGPSHPGGGRTWRLFLSGIMGGIVFLFKFVFLLILAGFWLTVLIHVAARKQESRPIAFVRVVAPLILGFLTPLVFVFGYFAWHQTLGILYLAFFEYPLRIVGGALTRDEVMIVQGLRFFVYNFAPLLSLALIGAYVSLRMRRDLMTLNLVLWVILGFSVILLERFGWEYHYFLPLVPLGILSVQGLDFLWRRLKPIGPLIGFRRVRIVAVISLALLFAPVLGSLTMKCLYLARDGFALKREQRLKFQSRLSTRFRTSLSEVRFLSEAASLSGDIYVFGNPLIYYLSSRSQATKLHGWSLELLLPEQWTQLAEQLAEARPPYIFVATSYRDIVWDHSPARFIQENYRVLRRSDAGIWYIIKESPQTHFRTAKRQFLAATKPKNVQSWLRHTTRTY